MHTKKKVGIILGTLIPLILIIAIIIIILLNPTRNIKIEHFKQKLTDKFLYKIHYKCKNGLIKAYSPEICCIYKDNSVSCDHKKLCRCKDPNTGFCKQCYKKSMPNRKHN